MNIIQRQQQRGSSISAHLHEQRTRDRERMRRYRDTLRSNASEYEEHKRRDRERTRLYRERLRAKDPGRYAEMNRKNAEAHRKKREILRTLAAAEDSVQQGASFPMESGYFTGIGMDNNWLVSDQMTSNVSANMAINVNINPNLSVLTENGGKTDTVDGGNTGTDHVTDRPDAEEQQEVEDTSAST